MKIIVDMMGGDNAPLAVLEGTAQAVKEYGVQVIGVGSEELVRKTAAEHNIPLDGIELVNCTETIEMCDEPARAIRSKKDSSIVVGLNLLKEGKGDAFVSAGSTGALHVGASLIVRTLKGVKRPALATMVPAKNKAYLLLDCGANVECRPEMLAAFAVMGSCYVNKVEGRTAPTVALANNGAEESKGTPMLREAHQLLKATPGIRFVGNIEPRDVPNGDVDVVVCDGFTGNVILKLTEGVAKMLLGMLKGMFLKNLGGKLAYVLLNRSFIRIVTTRRGQVKVRYEKKAMRASTQSAALYRRELARLTSSSGYMLNAGLGLVFELVLAVLAVVKRRELLGALTAIPELYAAAAPILLLACMMVSGMVFFTASSVSLEGKSYWIVRSMPVETKKILQAKLNLSNSLAVAPALVMMLAAALVLRVSAAETALLLACQLLFVLLTANVGLMEDLRHCNLDWINETQAAKQGAGVLLSMLLGFGFVVAVGALYFFLLAELMPTTAFLGLILALMAILYALTARWLMTRGVKRFETLR